MISVSRRLILVVGLGVSGIAVAKFLYQKGAIVSIYDYCDSESLKGSIEKLLEETQGYKIQYYLGNVDIAEVLKNIEMIIVSPGVPLSVPLIRLAIERKIQIIGEIELAYNFNKGRIVAITGTNGKTTTTSLVGEIVGSIYKKTFIAGNIGRPFIDVVQQTDDESISVLEISSFQLETIDSFNPNVSVVLNVSPDHLDRHGTYENYRSTKERIFISQEKKDICVLNYDDPLCKEMASKVKAKVIFFSMESDKDIYYKNGWIYIYHSPIIEVDKLKIPGRHNIENALAACAVAKALSIDNEVIAENLLSFRGVEHRLQYVATINGVDYYNDSKATNPDSAIKGIMAMKSPIVLIGGGYDKNVSFDNFIKAFENRVKKLIVMGQTTEQLINTANAYNYYNVQKVNDLEEAVYAAANAAASGDCVLLSPACASFGMFRNYEQRGEMFIDYVLNMKK